MANNDLWKWMFQRKKQAKAQLEWRQSAGDEKHNCVPTEAEALAEDASGRHVFLRFNLCEVEGAGEDENICKVDEALQEGYWSLNSQALGWLYLL